VRGNSLAHNRQIREQTGNGSIPSLVVAFSAGAAGGEGLDMTTLLSREGILGEACFCFPVVLGGDGGVVAVVCPSCSSRNSTFCEVVL
jgi:hypothetical protein